MNKKNNKNVLNRIYLFITKYYCRDSFKSSRCCKALKLNIKSSKEYKQLCIYTK